MNYITLATDHVASLYPEIFYGKPPLMMLPPGAILGNWQYSIPGKMRFIFDRTSEIAPGVLPSDLARAWVRDQYRLPLKRRKSQLTRGFPPPMYAKRGKYGDCAYVDINKAYVQVLKFGFDVEYELGRYIASEPRPVPGEIATCKPAYSISVSMSNSARSNLEVMGREGVFDRHPLNLFSNPCLFNLARETLNGIGAEMLAVLGDHVKYMNTDGYIVDLEVVPYAIEIVRSWGLVASIKERDGEQIIGETKIRGTSSWKVGKFETRRNDPNALDYCGPLMDRDQRRWLKSNWYYWRNELEGVS